MRYLLGPLVFIACFHYISMMEPTKPKRRLIKVTGDNKIEIYDTTRQTFVPERPYRERKSRNQSAGKEPASSQSIDLNQKVEEELPLTLSLGNRRVSQKTNNNSPQHTSTFQQNTGNYNSEPFTGLTLGPHPNTGSMQFNNQRTGHSQDNYSARPGQNQGYIHYQASPNFQTNHPNFQNNYPPQSFGGTHIYPPQSFGGTPVFHEFPIHRPVPDQPFQQSRTNHQDGQDNQSKYM